MMNFRNNSVQTKETMSERQLQNFGKIATVLMHCCGEQKMLAPPFPHAGGNRQVMCMNAETYEKLA